MMMRWMLSLSAGLALAAAMSVSAIAREIVVENDCERFAFVLYVHYLDSGSGNWETRDYLFPHWSYGETMYLTKETSAFKTRPLDTELTRMYFHAQSIGWIRYVWEGDDHFEMNGDKYDPERIGFRKHKNTGYHLDLTLTCDNIEVDEECWATARRPITTAYACRRARAG